MRKALFIFLGFLATNCHALGIDYGGGTIQNSRLDSSSVTLQGNSFNAASKLLQLDSANRLPGNQIVAGSATVQSSAGLLISGPVNASSEVITGQSIIQGSMTVQGTGLSILGTASPNALSVTTFITASSITTSGQAVVQGSATVQSSAGLLVSGPINASSAVITGQGIVQGTFTSQGAASAQSLAATNFVTASSLTTTGQIVAQGTATVQGNAFSVGTSTFTINQATVVVSGTEFQVTATTTMIKGSVSGYGAPAGYLGEFLSNTLGSAQVPATSTNYVAIATISLTAGDWDVSGACQATMGGTTAATVIDCGISTSNTSLDTRAQNNNSYTSAASFPTSDSQIKNVGIRRVLISATTSYYLVASLTYTTLGGATWATNSTMQARRVR